MPTDDDDYEHLPPAKASNGLAVAGVILGVLSFCTLGLTGFPALICSAIALGKPAGRGLAIAGLALGGLGTAAGVGLVVVLLTDGINTMRFSGGRERDEKNLQRIGRGFSAQADKSNGVTAPFAPSANGGVNRGLSFRVGLLPHIGYGFVHDKFDTAQPWDGPRNRPHSDMSIDVYVSPSEGNPASRDTPYRVFYGGGAMFDDDGQPVAFTDVRDGTSNTILLVHAAEPVRWAEPRELKYSADAPLPELWDKRAGGGNVLLADGSVRFIKKNVSERTIRSAITRSGGEEMGSDW